MVEQPNGSVEYKADNPSPQTIVAAMVVGTCSLAANGVQPVILGALTGASRLSEGQAGGLASAEMLALALASFVGVPFFRRGSMRLKTMIVSLLLVAVDVSAHRSGSIESLFALRTVAGILEGLLMGVMSLVTIASRSADRLTGLFWGAAAIPIAVAAYVIPVIAVPAFGVNGGFYVLTIFALSSAAAAGLLPHQISALSHSRTRATRWRVPTYLAFTGILLQSAADGGAWGYLDLLAIQKHFPEGVAGTAVSLGLVAQVIGALLASLLSRRIPYRAVLITQCLVTSVLLLALAQCESVSAYLIASLAINFLMLAQMPFQILLLLSLDTTRRSALYSNAVGMVGLSVGPTMCALGVRGSDVEGAFTIAAAAMFIALFCFILVRPSRALVNGAGEFS